MPTDSLSSPGAVSSTIDAAGEAVTAWIREVIRAGRSDGDAPSEIAASIKRQFPGQFRDLDIIEDAQVWGKEVDSNWSWSILIGEKSTGAERQLRESFGRR